MSENKKGCIMVTIAAICWGLGGIAAQELYKISDIPSLFVVFLRMTAMAAVFLPISLIKRKTDPFRCFKDKKDVLTLLLFALIGGTYVQFSYYEAIRYSNAATGTVLQYAAPVFVLIAMAFIKRRLPSLIDILCVIMAVAGIFLISTHGNPGSLAISPKAIFFGITSAMSYAFYTIEPVGFIKKYGAMYLLGFASLISALALMLSGLAEPYKIQSLAEMGYILFILVFGSVTAFGLFLSGVGKIGATPAIVLSALEPLVSAVVSVLFFSVPFALPDGIGIFLVMAAVLTLSLRGEKNRD